MAIGNPRTSHEGVQLKNQRTNWEIFQQAAFDCRRASSLFPKKMGEPPVIIHFSRIFHEINHPAIGVPPWKPPFVLHRLTSATAISRRTSISSVPTMENAAFNNKNGVFYPGIWGAGKERWIKPPPGQAG